MENKINEESLKKLTNIRDSSLQVRNAMGDLEIRKQELFIQYLNLKNNMDKEAEAALLEAGIDAKEVKEYKIDLKTGTFTK